MQSRAPPSAGDVGIRVLSGPRLRGLNGPAGSVYSIVGPGTYRFTVRLHSLLLDEMSRASGSLDTIRSQQDANRRRVPTEAWDSVLIMQAAQDQVRYQRCRAVYTVSEKRCRMLVRSHLGATLSCRATLNHSAQTT